MNIITGTKEAVVNVRKLTDAKSSLPNQLRACKCGAFGIEIENDDNDMVKCTSCGLIQHSGEVHATLRCYRDITVDGITECIVPDSIIEEKLKSNDVKIADKTEKDKLLGAVEIKEEPTNPNPKDPGKDEPIIEKINP